MLESITLLKKVKIIKRKILKRSINFKLFSPLHSAATNPKYFKNVLFFYKYFLLHLQCKGFTTASTFSTKHHEDTKTLTVTQKTSNLKATVSTNSRNISTFTVGTLLKHFKVKQGKFLRRSVKGTKLFLNSLKSILQKKYRASNNTLLLVKISGFNYNLMSAKRNVYNALTSANNDNNSFIFLFAVKLSFTKQKEKKKKSIKKRLKKKILLNFLKSNKINLV